jgi:hypothetical protein
MDNPVQTKCSTGKRNLLLLELRSSSTYSRQGQVFSVELLRSPVGEAYYSKYPVLHFVCTGLSIFKSYGLKNRE